MVMSIFLCHVLFHRSAISKDHLIKTTTVSMIFKKWAIFYTLRVENLEDSIAISGNFVDDTNVIEASNHLLHHALLDHRAGELLEEWLHRGLIKWQSSLCKYLTTVCRYHSPTEKGHFTNDNDDGQDHYWNGFHSHVKCFPNRGKKGYSTL